MVIRLTIVEDADGPVILVAGHLDRGVLGELTRMCEQAEGPLRLDLSDLTGTDEAGIEALRRLKNSGAELIKLRPYLKLLLERGE